MISRRVTTLWLLLATLACPSAPAKSAPPFPSFLLIIADDCTYRDMEVYGGQAKTPHLGKLAGEGMTFTRCFQAAPMCSPTRYCLYTGLYPVKSGAYPNHTMAYDWVKSIAQYLQAAGYRTHLSGKTHIGPKADPWNQTNRIENAELSGVRDALRLKLDAWMKQQGDEGQATEMKALERMPRHAGRNAPEADDI